MNAQTQSQRDRTTRRANRRLIQMRLDAVGLTQTELARRLGLTPQAVNNTLIGAKPSPRVLDALRGLGVPDEYLFAQHSKKVA